MAKIPKYLRRAGTAIGQSLAQAGVKAVQGATGTSGGRLPKYLRRAGTSIGKSLAEAGVRAATSALAGGCMRCMKPKRRKASRRGVSNKVYAPISGRYLRQLNGYGFVPS